MQFNVVYIKIISIHHMKQPLFQGILPLCVAAIDLTKKRMILQPINLMTRLSWWLLVCQDDSCVMSHKVETHSIDASFKSQQIPWILVSHDIRIFPAFEWQKRTFPKEAPKTWIEARGKVLLLGEILSILVVCTSPTTHFPDIVSSLFQGTCTHHQCQYELLSSPVICQSHYSVCLIQAQLQ